METSQQQRGSTIGQFAKTLADAKLDFDAIDLADILWLAQFIEPAKSSRPDTPQQKSAEQIPKHTQKNDHSESKVNLYSDKSLFENKPKDITSGQKLDQKAEKQSGTPFSVPAAPALRNRLDLARSLRPLMCKIPSSTRFELDEDATVAQIAETGVWLPVVRPVAERWLQLDLVVEESKTTVIWERAIMELNHLVEYQGAFRSVRTWRLSAQTGKLQLFSRWRDASIHSVAKTELVINQRFHTPKELIDPTGRSLIWLVTDCTSTLWRQSLIYETLLAWAKVQPIAIFQMFPERLWSRTALRDGHIVKLGSLFPGLLSKQLVIEGLPQRLEQGNHRDLVTVSIITLDAALMLLWARVASGFGDYRTPGRTFDLSFIRRQTEKGKSDPSPKSSAERTAQERVALFRSTASKTAQQLADFMAATPVNLPVIDLLRDAFHADFQEEVQQSHVAEVLLSGLLRRCDTEEDDLCRYEFWGDNSGNGDERVRDILLGDTSISKTIEVLNVLSASICQKLRNPLKTFEALLGDIQALEGDQWNEVLPFARVGLNVLRRLGGEYAALADKYRSVTEIVGNRDRPLLPVAELELPGGTIQLASRFYVQREPLESDCYKQIEKNAGLIRIKAPRQMGKTSLLARICHHAVEQGYRTATLDFLETDEAIFEDLTVFLKRFCALISRKLGISPRKVSEFWDEELFGPKENCNDYFEQCILGDLTVPLFLGLDELDRLFPYSPVANEFLSLLRSWNEKAKVNETWAKLRMVIAHSAEIYVPLDPNFSPFNVGMAVELREFNQEQVLDLVGRHGLGWEMKQVNQLMNMVGGHPYLVRLALYHIAQGDLTLSQLLATAATDAGIYGEHLRQHLWNLQQNPELAVAFQQVVGTEEPVCLPPMSAFKLNGMGLVTLQGSEVVLRHQSLYRPYFQSRLRVRT